MEREHILQLAQSLRWCAPQVHAHNPQIGQVMRDAADMLQMLSIKLAQKTDVPTVPDLISMHKAATQHMIQQLKGQSLHTQYDLALDHVQEQLVRLYDLVQKPGQD